MDVPPIIDSTLTSPKQARIELEPVDVPLEQDDSILLSALQSVIPGAHGLYYQDEDGKKALKYNGETGCISKGPPGWNSKPIYVVLAHGCRHFNNASAGQYDTATERFEKTVNLIQRMLGKSDRWMSPQSHKKDSSTRSAHLHANEGNCDGRADEEERSDGSLPENHSKTSADIRKPQTENDILKQSNLQTHSSTYNVKKEEEPENEKFNRPKEETEYQVIEKKSEMDYLEQTISDLELKLSEHKQLFDASQDRIRDLEIMLDEEKKEVKSLKNLNAELNAKFESLSLGQKPEIGYDSIQQQWSNEEMDKKNDEICKLNKQIDDLKWSLGEHKQWLADANNRENHLENMCKEKDCVINDMTNRLCDLEGRLSDVPPPQSTENLNSLINDMRGEIDGKNNYIDQLEKAKSDLQWYLGEHQHWLQDANNKIGILENEKSEGVRKIRELEEMLNQIETFSAANDFSEMKAKVEELQQKMEDKRFECDKLNEQKDELKASLVEHKVWLEDAKNRIKYLEDEEGEKQNWIVDIIKELGELKAIRIDAFQQLHEKIDDLEIYLNKNQQQQTEIKSNNDCNDYKMRIEELLRELNEANQNVVNSERSKNDTERNLVEHRQWLTDAKKKIDELESKLQAIGNENDSLREEIEELNNNIRTSMGTIEGLQKEINDKNEQLNFITKQKNDVEWNFDKQEQLLKDANNRVSELESILLEKNHFIEELKKYSEERFEEEASLNGKLQTSEKALTEAPDRDKLNKLSSMVDCLQNELNDKNEYIKNLAKQCSDAEWSLGEHRQWLQDVNNRVQGLENELCSRNGHVEELRQEIGNRNADISNCHVTIDALNSELSEKNLCIANAEKAKNDAEWSLGEHRQWLQNANNRIDELTHDVEVKDREIEELRKPLEDALLLEAVQKELLENLTSKLRETEEALAKAPKPNELSALESTIEDIRREINNKNAYINDLEKQRNDLEWSLGEHRQWLQNANERIADLENYDKGKDELIRELHNEMDELSKKAVLDLKAALEAVKNEAQLKKSEQVPIEQLMAKLHNSEQALAEQPKLDDLICLRNENENLKKVLKDKSECIDGLTQQKNDLEWSLGEHRQWLQDCNDRANWLDSIVVAKNGEIDALRCENDRLKTDLAKISQNGDINELTATIENLRNEINNKNNDINEMMKQRNEAEWKLGEHRQWLADANNRADDLAGKLIEKQHALSLLLEKHPESVEEEHNKISATSLGSEPTEIDKSTLFEKIFELEAKLMEAERIAAAAAEIRDVHQLKVEYEMALAKLREELNEKDADLVRVNKDRSDAEWFLGEERQRLSDANQRISHLEEELACLKVKHAEVLNNLRNETCELNEKNNKLKEALGNMEAVLRELSKDAKMTMLILGESEGSGNLKEEFKRLCEKYMQLISLLGTVQEHLAKRQIEASEFVNSKELWKVIENLNNELHQRKAENENLLQKKNDAEWQLDEHREWLRNANNRIIELEEELAHIKKASERALEISRMENETLNQKNAQLKEDVKHLQDEVRNLLTSVTDRTEEVEKNSCQECKEVSALNRVENVGEELRELSSISPLLENLRKELNYQKIIDTLMEQHSKTEQLLEERRESITNAYNKIVELEKQLLENTLEEQLEETGSHEEIDEIRQQLNDGNAEVKNLVRLKSELERNLEEVIIRNEEMSALLDQKEETINAIINERNAIEAERNSLKQQVDTLKQRCHSLPSTEMELSNEGQNSTELMVRLCEKEDLLQQFTTEIAEKVQEITNLHNVIKDLRDVNNEKNQIIDDLNRITSEKEWNLGEYRQWLSDANNKVDNLERELNDVRQREKSNKTELDRLTSEMDEKNAKISELHNKLAKLESEAINVQYGKETIPDEQLSSELSALREKLLHMEEYVQFQDEELRRLREEQTLANEQHDVSSKNTAIQSHGVDKVMMSEEYHELSSELITLNRKKYELEEKMKRVENDLQESYEKIKWLEDEKRKEDEEVWLAKERVANQDRELQNLHGECSWLRDENARLQNELSEERRKNVENGGVDWAKFDEMKNEMKQVENTLRDEKSKVEWRLGEVTQYWNDAKWKIGELEAGMAHKDWLLDQAHQKIYELDQMYRFRDTTKSVLDGAFLIKKQPTGDRCKWRLAMWNDSSPEDLKDYRRIWFEIRAPTAKIVLLGASFVSWECFLLCQKLDNDTDKFGVWVDVPPGRYEFVFVVDGQWTISDNYGSCWNEHGTHNNWRYVD